MTCVKLNSITTVCINPFYKLRLDNGDHVFMEWHKYLGPTFYKDKKSNREITNWWDNQLIIKAFSWFIGRGNKA